MVAPDSPLIFERDGHVAIVTMNRPQSRNAFNLEMLCRMADAWAAIDADEQIRVAIWTGAGWHFCAGSDLKEMSQARPDDVWQARLREEPELHWRAMLRSYRLKKPLLAAVEGVAMGGGTEFLQATDIRIAGEGAVFGLTEARLGLFPLGGSTVRLRRQIPYCQAMEILLTGRKLSASEAVSMGLINRVVPAGQALSEARKVAELIAGNGPLAVQAIKRSVIASEGLPEEAALAKELEIGWPILSTQDAKEGAKAFVEKRKPRFVGK
jgi:enoyl-CoA hydratase